MSRDPERLLAESLELPTADRARLAARLLASLEPPEGTAAEIEAAWAEELRARVESIEAGEPLEDWKDVRDRTLARLRRPR